MLDALARQHERLNIALETIPPHMWRNQYHPDLSPIGWHYAHCHFIEAVWLRERVLGLDAHSTHDWHDLYFPEWSPKWRRGGRLPAGESLLAWGRDCQARHRDWLATEPDIRRHPLLDDGYLVGFLAQHHAMHLETLAQVLWFARLREPNAGASVSHRPTLHSPTAGAWVEWDATSTTVGTTDVLAFDNEQGVHTVALAPFAIRRDPVTNAEWTAFIEDHGYSRDELWSDEGRAWRDTHAIQAPLGWRESGAGMGLQVLPEDTIQRQPDAPVVGISQFEAEAFARWAIARLPHEHEWEHACREGALQGTGRVWEWCANPFAPYPGFRPFPYHEYSAPWFDGQHYVLRGGSDWSDPLLKRPSMRNFFTPEKRHVFAGLRLARTLEP
ncbi:protein of unknown function DUF323 [Thioalkalivibrio sp. K90mix]|uniref:SUMF1/EgtB/PvdO family nonheme iron enzyme n=1 Tax=Thioalkalivibrio sp. (strain K90mix) TaxID=396595 RepID=UPI000195A9B5|nr:SUMF1/EgtB/PvdO family nonheme iron enzyme [Thioalkalivibrio sp. K90mix]ADC71454.1 protein of unknown function DUF323 [Thioalkalivibrio sp. K90mix]